MVPPTRINSMGNPGAFKVVIYSSPFAHAVFGQPQVILPMSAPDRMQQLKDTLQERTDKLQADADEKEERELQVLRTLERIESDKLKGRPSTIQDLEHVQAEEDAAAREPPPSRGTSCRYLCLRDVVRDETMAACCFSCIYNTVFPVRCPRLGHAWARNHVGAGRQASVEADLGLPGGLRSLRRHVRPARWRARVSPALRLPDARGADPGGFASSGGCEPTDVGGGEADEYEDVDVDGI